MTNKHSSQAATVISRREGKSKLPVILSCLGVLGLLAVVLFVGGYFYMTASAASQSVVLIREPQNGDRITANQPIRVRALARDDSKITRIELWADGQLIDAQTSNVQGGINPFPLLTTWYPQVGLHTMTVRAFNGRGGTTQSSISVEAVMMADQDMDGIADEDDVCPDHPGNPAAYGCPDRDFDGIADTIDACPDEAGLPESGCPLPGEGDRDGDGVLDGADACPDEAGSPLANGCPDADGDGTGDLSDACPTEPGGGEDGCPDAGGVLEPEPGGALPEPLPGEEPPDPADDDEPEPSGPGSVDFDLGEPIALEIEAYELWITGDYESAWCYVRLGEEDPRRYDFEPLGERYWDIAAELAGENSVRLLHAEHQPIQLSAECLGSNPGLPPASLGTIAVTHLPSDWDGRELHAHSGATAIRYRICSPSCDESTLPAPMIVITTDPPVPPWETPYTLRWRWDGDNTAIDGFGLIVSTMGEYTGVDIPNPEMRSLNIADYMPACGETVSFQLYAYQAEGEIRSRLSNERYWSGDPCTYTASVTFMTLDVHDPPADEDSLHQPGPIYGEFWVSNGTTTEMLEFNACWCYFGPGMTFWGWCEGLKLQHAVYSINRDIFDWIDTAQASCFGGSCHENDFYAPYDSTLHIPFEDGNDLTVGGRIMDCDERGNTDDVLFQEQEGLRINVEDLEYLTVPIPLGLNGDHVNLDLFIRLGR